MSRASERVQALWERVPAEVRQVTREAASVVGSELRQIRRPRDVRRVLRDPQFLTRLAQPLTPALDRIAETAAKGTVPMGRQVALAAAGTTGLLGAAAGSALEIASLLEIEVPPVALSTASAAGAIAVVGELIEFYVVASYIRHELEEASAFEPSALRAALVETYLGSTDGQRSLLTSMTPRIAVAIVRRALPRLVPVANIAFAPVSSVRTVLRAKDAVARAVAARADAGEEGGRQ